MIDGTIADGAYVVTWQSAGDDGHLQKGDFKFTFKAAK
jgi:methionine-rich copper-binding protein CopC